MSQFKNNIKRVWVMIMLFMQKYVWALFAYKCVKLLSKYQNFDRFIKKTLKILLTNSIACFK